MVHTHSHSDVRRNHRQCETVEGPQYAYDMHRSKSRNFGQIDFETKLSLSLLTPLHSHKRSHWKHVTVNVL